jgi:fermentation-respiration switch protein FrsA (DUF1100 family)
MCVPWVPLFVRRILIALSVLGLVFGAEIVRRRSAICRERVSRHSTERVRLLADRNDRLQEAKANPPLRAVLLFDADRHKQAISWHEARETEFRQVEWQPWKFIPSDQTDPPWPAIPPELYPIAKPEPALVPASSRMTVVDTFLFHPLRYPFGDWTKKDPAVEDVWFKSPDGLRLNGWFVEAKQPRAVVLYAEGSAGNMTSRRWVLDLFRDRLKCSVFLFDYRGYGRSEGTPSQPGVLKDARAARQWLAKRTGVAESEIVLVGHSLGGAVAADLAAHDGARGLVLENTFFSLPELTEWHFGSLARKLVTNDLNTAAKIASYKGPLLQTHGNADALVPFDSGKRLFEAANSPKQFVEVPQGGHNDLPKPPYINELDKFLAALPVAK